MVLGHHQVEAAEHRHSGIALYTPADVHYRRTPALDEARAGVLAGAYAARVAHRRLDQPALEEGGVDSVIESVWCLTRLDRFRGGAPAIRLHTL